MPRAMHVATEKRLIVALDVPSSKHALELVEELDGIVSHYKLGLELLMAGGLEPLSQKLSGKNELFVDLKLPSDIPTTVRRTVSRAAELGVKLFTLSGSATRETIEAALAGRGNQPGPKLLFVPYLSSQGQDAADGADFQATLLEKARFAAEAGVDGFIVSGREIGVLRRAFPRALLVSPGIRQKGAKLDDHQRSCTPEEAIELGADYLVVGRPIRDAADRRAAARAIIEEIASAFQH